MSYTHCKYVICLFGLRYLDSYILSVQNLDLPVGDPECSTIVRGIPRKTAEFLLDHFPFVSFDVANVSSVDLEYHLKASLDNEEKDFSNNEIFTNDPMTCAVVIECAKWIIF